ncbi:hypothetical protein N8550_03625 [Pirellulaceae bacterium]|nr:hypothetical protein [Pirellulaceae bacterium]
MRWITRRRVCGKSASRRGFLERMFDQESNCQKSETPFIAPTIAKLLRRKHPGAEGKPLLDAIQTSGS